MVAAHQQPCNVGDNQAQKADRPNNRRGNTGQQYCNDRNDDPAAGDIDPETPGRLILQGK